MQIRLTVLGSRSGHQPATAPVSCDVLVTAPAGTALAAVASGLAATVGGPDTGGTVVLYAGAERLDLQRRVLGEPPLVDGAVVALHGPVPDVLPEESLGAPRLHVVAGPDAGGVHLLHSGQIRVGRSADADVPLDDPDVSRLHCAVTVMPDGRVSVADLDSTNGTTLDGSPVGPQPVALPPGALLRVGESTLRLAPAGATDAAALPVVPDLEGHFSLPGRAAPASGAGHGAGHAARGPRGTFPDPPPTASGAAGPATGPGEPLGSHPGPGTPGWTTTGGPATSPAGPLGGHPEPGTPGWTTTGGSPDASGTGGSAAHPQTGPAGQDPALPGTGRTGIPGSTPHPSGAAEPATGGSAAHPQTTPAGRGPVLPGTGRTGIPGSTPHPSGAAEPATGPGAPLEGRPAPGATGWPAPGGSAAYPQTAPAGRGPALPGTGRAGTPGSTAHASGSGPGEAGGPAAGPQGAHPAPSHSADRRLRRVAGSAPDTGGAGAGRGGVPDPAVPTASGAAGSGTPGPVPAHPGSRPATGAHGAGFGAGRDAGARAGRGAAPDPAVPAASGAAGAGAPAGRRRGLGAWARKWVRGEEAAQAPVEPAAAAEAAPDPDDPAALLLAALGPTERLWSRGPGHPGLLDVGLGAGSRVSLRTVGALGIAGPRARLAGVARCVIAQLAGLHAPGQLEIVLLSTDRARTLAERRRDWAWLGWLPHVRPAHGQDCRLLLAYDRDQAAARTGELTRRLDDGPLGTHWAAADAEQVRQAAEAYEGPYTLVVLDGDPGAGPLRDITGRLASHGPAAGIHVLALAEAPAATPASPVTETYEAACASTPAFRDCDAVALLSGDVATAVRTFAVSGGRPVPSGGTATADAVSAAWAERFARALAPLRGDGGTVEPYRPAAATLPATARLLDELGLARATPASLMARWAAATDQGQGVGGLAEIVLGSGRRGVVGAELVHDGPHLLVEGPAGSGRTELLRSVAASLSAAARPDRLGLVLLDGAGGERGDGLLPCTELPHVSAHLVASDPLRMREFAQALGAELKRRDELLDGLAFAEWHARREVSDRMVSPRQPTPGELRGDLDSQRTGTLRLRASATRTDPAGPSPLPRLVVLVDDFDALVAPGLGATGRPAAGSVVRVLEAVAREGARLGVHLVAASARPDRTADTGLARLTTLRVELDAPDQPGPGRGLLRYADGRTVAFQAGRVTGRIPRTATLRPTVVPVEWERMGDPPARRPVRELGNGPTDLALLASALDRASHLVSAIPVLFPAAP
ncbi:FHA domain-containing protein [Streptomyces sp. NPDC048258]|uniref:FHA domain-containing protein n=1 Tax=Streptomyces sp. NPDC048258 TaxID=3365527 RepID=UPI003722AB89